jgi:predicted acetyltransferase
MIKRIGFSLVNRITINSLNSISIAEFYIKPKFRRKKFGLEFVKLILNKFSQNEIWEISYQNTNLAAKNFWSKIYHNINEYNIDLIEKT